MTATGVRPGVRRFVLAFLVVFLGTSLAGVEAWPITGWGLYSRRLTDHVEEWKLVTVDGRGEEHAIPWSRMPMAYRYSYRQLSRVVAAPPAEQERACRAWADGVRAVGEEVVAVRVYRTETRRRFEGASTVLSRRLALTCAEGDP